MKSGTCIFGVDDGLHGPFSRKYYLIQTYFWSKTTTLLQMHTLVYVVMFFEKKKRIDKIFLKKLLLNSYLVV